jgi:hypothetical protein
LVLRLSRVYFLLLIPFFFTGCVAITGHGDSLHSFDAILKNSTCNYTFVDKKIEDKDDVILWASQGGSLSRNCFDYNRSNSFFDKAEDLYKTNVDLQSNVNRAGNTTNSILVNNNVNEYKGNVYETVMLNTYKGLNFMALDDFENARVEFNRALDRQRRAKDYFSKEIKKAKQKSKKDKNYELAQNRYTQEAIYDRYRDIFSGFKAYPDFVNPYTTYISGVFFLLDGDYTKARDLLKESLAMQPDNGQIKKDFELADSLSGFAQKDKNYAWIIYENGQSMAKREININIPLFIFTNKVYYAGLALPKLYERPSSYEFLEVDGKKTMLIANMDNIIKAEFEKRFAQIALEATLNLIVKTYTQYELNKQGSFGGFAGMLYQSLTNRADIRSWTALPKNFQSLRVELNQKPVIIRDDRGRVISTVQVQDNQDVLIYIKSFSKEDIKVHKIIKGKK